MVTGQSRDARRLRELEAENRALRKQIDEKNEIINVLKNPSAYIPGHRAEVPVHPYRPHGSFCGAAMPIA